MSKENLHVIYTRIDEIRGRPFSACEKPNLGKKKKETGVNYHLARYKMLYWQRNQGLNVTLLT